jgi:hypothetical protein
MIYVVTLQSSDSERASIHSLRAVLKYARRRRLRILAIREQQAILCRDARHGLSNTRSVETVETITKTVKTKETTMANLRKYGPTNRFLKPENLLDKPPMRERIGLVEPDSKGKFGERLVVTFEPSGWKLSLNRTSVGNLLRDLGDDDSDWVGKLVEIFAGEVETQNGPTDAILVRVVPDAPVDATIAAKATKTKAKTAKSSDIMDDEIDF